MLNNLISKRDKIIKKKNIIEQELKRVNNELKQTEYIIRKTCNHCWVTDFIDKPYGEGSQRIVYCEVCFLNKV
tara:strand:+ start:325 stop:543 length:219 start_codon:yes stop_codon:yes gene_type:complete